MYDGWFCLGGTEIINNTRAIDYARSINCPVTWFRDDGCEGINDRLDEPPYDFLTISSAPWFDPDLPVLSSEFMGVYCITENGLEDETLTAPIIERVVSGGVIGRQRDSAKSVRFRVILTGTTARGREYGRAWLAQVLRENMCSMHDGSCGTADLRFMTMCPPPYDPDSGSSIGMYWDEMDQETRVLHGVKCTTGLIKEQEFERERAYGAIYEFTLTAEKPRMLGVPYFLSPANQGNLVIQDAPFNLHPTPSAELSSGTVVVAENLSPNPSLETSDADWYSNAGGAIAFGNIASGRVVGELSAVGVASYRTVFTAPGASAAPGSFENFHEVMIAGTPAGTRFSFNIWSAIVVMAGAPVLNDIEIVVEWWNSAPAIIRTDSLGIIPAAGGPLSAKSILPPVGSTLITLRAIANLSSWNAGTIVRLYSDAVAVTIP